jgi:hypothetical protein
VVPARLPAFSDSR